MVNNNSSNTCITVSSQGYINYPLQPAFSAFLDTTVTNATGDGTVFQIGSVTALTEILDIGSNFNTNGTFTAPVNGIYIFNISVSLMDLSVGHTNASLTLVAGGITYSLNYNPQAIKSSNGVISVARSMTIPLNASDTAVVNIAVSGSTKTVSIWSHAPGLNNQTAFSGFLLG